MMKELLSKVLKIKCIEFYVHILFIYIVVKDFLWSPELTSIYMKNEYEYSQVDVCMVVG